MRQRYQLLPDPRRKQQTTGDNLMTTQTATSQPQNMRAFMTVWLGELVSMIGSSLTVFGLGVFMFQKTGQATPFALTMFFFQLPTILLAPLGGIVADRYNRRLVMLAADALSAVGSLAAVWLVATNGLEVWHVYGLAVTYAISNAFQEPAYMASITMMVPKAQLGRANGMMQMGQALTSLIGPLLAGALYAPLGLTGLITIDFATFFIAIGALALVRIPRPEAATAETKAKKSFWQEAMFGWRYIGARAGLLGLLIYFAIINFLANLAFVLIGPLVLSFTTPDVYGILQAVGGFAMLAGSIVMSAWGGPKRRMLAVYGFIALATPGLILIGLQPAPVMIGAGFVVLMFFIPLGSGASSALWQTKTDPAAQGRVFSVRIMISRALMPLAMLIAGPLADFVFEPFMRGSSPLATQIGAVIGSGAGRGVGLIFVLAGTLSLLATLAAFLNPRIRNLEDELPDFAPVTAPDETGEALTQTATAGAK